MPLNVSINALGGGRRGGEGRGGYHQCIGGCSVTWVDIVSDLGGYCQCIGGGGGGEGGMFSALGISSVH